MSELEPITMKLKVFYDGACPLCRREMAFYKNQRGSESIMWLDVSTVSDGCEIVTGLSKEDALLRFHVQEANGTIRSGGSAFAKVWTTLPLLSPLGKLFQIRAFSGILEIGYSIFLRARRRRIEFDQSPF